MILQPFSLSEAWNSFQICQDLSQKLINTVVHSVEINSSKRKRADNG